MKRKIVEEIEKLHKENKHDKIIQIIYSMNENDRDHIIISLLARALNNIQNYDEALNHLMYIREEAIDDPLWYFRTGYAYYYSGNKETAKTYIKKTIELIEKQNIQNNELYEESERLYKLCFEDEDNNISFTQRVDMFWRWFDENEYEISQMIENKSNELIDFVNNGIKIISDDISFNINKNYEFIFYADGKNYLFYLIPRIIYAMPEKFYGKWSFLPCIPSSNGNDFSIQINGNYISTNEILVKMEFDEENDKFDLIFYNEYFNTIDTEEAYNIFLLMMENSIGEGLAKVYIRYADISNKKLKNMMPLTELEEYINKTLIFFRKELITKPIDQHFSYTFEPKDIELPRYDIITGTTSYYETINDYYNGIVDDIVAISQYGARALFLTYSYDDDNDDKVKREILNERYEIQYRLEKEVLGEKESGECIGIVLGGAIGIYNIYIDLIIYNEKEFIKRAKVFLAEYDRNFYISKLRKYADMKNIFDYYIDEE